jgi:hypothetical protein
MQVKVLLQTDSLDVKQVPVGRINAGTYACSAIWFSEPSYKQDSAKYPDICIQISDTLFKCLTMK